MTIEMTIPEKTRMAEQEIEFRHGMSSNKLERAIARLERAMDPAEKGDYPAAENELKTAVMPFLLGEVHCVDLISEIRRYGFRPTEEFSDCKAKFGELARNYYIIRGKIAEPALLNPQKIAADINNLITEAREFQTKLPGIKANLLKEIDRQAQPAKTP